MKLQLIKIGTLLSLSVFSLIAVEIELDIDLSENNPLTAAIFRGADEAFKQNSDGLDALESGNLKLAETLF